LRKALHPRIIPSTGHKGGDNEGAAPAGERNHGAGDQQPDGVAERGGGKVVAEGTTLPFAHALRDDGQPRRVGAARAQAGEAIEQQGRSETFGKEGEQQAADHRRAARQQVDAACAEAVGEKADREQGNQEADVIGRLHHAGLPCTELPVGTQQRQYRRPGGEHRGESRARGAELEQPEHGRTLTRQRQD
jgi:hypothetical protein